MLEKVNYSHDLKEKAFKPGPGAYSPDQTPVKEKSPGYKIGSEKRDEYRKRKAEEFK